MWGGTSAARGNPPESTSLAGKPCVCPRRRNWDAMPLLANQVRVALTARVFRHNHGRRAGREESAGRGPDQESIGIEFRSRDVLDGIVLEQDGFAAQLEPKQTQLLRESVPPGMSRALFC